MSDIRDHYNARTPIERLVNTARKAALDSMESHKYLPRTEEEAENFALHAWVQDALVRAYSMGKTDGAEEVRKSIRMAIGAAKG